MGSVLSLPFSYFHFKSQETAKLMSTIRKAECREQELRALLELRYKIERMEQLGARQSVQLVHKTPRLDSIKQFFEDADVIGYGILRESAGEVFRDTEKLAVYYCRVYDFLTRRIHCFHDDNDEHIFDCEDIGEIDIMSYFREEDLKKLAMCLEKVDF